MKYIKKAGAPHSYRIWYKQVCGTQDEDFRELKNPVKADLQRGLLKEQGWLCAYTMHRIDSHNSHIEHIKPESLCRAHQRGSDLYYENLVACFPRDGMKRENRYGAPKKDDWWEEDGADFVSPLHPACEKHFSFALDGEITAVNNHRAALATIKVLALCHPSLTDDRKRVIAEVLYGPKGDDPLSLAKADQIKANICTRSSDGRFYEFCVAIRNALDEYLRNLQKAKRRRRFAHRKR
ncbi:MAG: retron system putative HNH endonuclease [Acidobacteriota bacterium]